MTGPSLRRNSDSESRAASRSSLLANSAVSYRSENSDSEHPNDSENLVKTSALSSYEKSVTNAMADWSDSGSYRWVPPTIGAVGCLLGLAIWFSGKGPVSALPSALLVALLAMLAALALRLAMLAVAEQRRVEEAVNAQIDRIATESLTDDLTGLVNRRGITLEVEQRMCHAPEGKLLGVLFCDLDRLKVVNDSLGHEAGDEVLRVAAARIERIVREDDVVGRFGADEFVIVSSGLPTVRDMEILGDRIVRSLRKPIVLGEDSTQVVPGSVGIAWTATLGSSADPDSLAKNQSRASNLLRDADAALCRAKEQGGSCYSVFDEALRAQVVSRLQLEQELRRGIRRGEIEVHYQPIIDRTQTSVNRVEALVRWNHPDRGIVFPGEFLSIAAESLLIVELGELVVLEACRQAVAWTETYGRPISVAVNIGERQLLDRNLTDLVSKALAHSGLSPQQLELEIAEDLVMDQVDKSLQVLRQLELLGVQLAIDDFGTSRASLSRLKSLAMVSTLKLDRAFVEGLGTDEIDLKIADAVVSLAESLEMSVVAEGVETKQQAEILEDLGVTQMQGFYFCRPQPESEISRVIAAEVVSFS